MLYWHFTTVAASSTALSTIEFSADGGTVSGAAPFNAGNSYVLNLQAATNPTPQYYLSVAPPPGGVPASSPNLVIATNGLGLITNAAEAAHLIWAPWTGQSISQPIGTLTQNGLSFGLALVDLDVLFPGNPEAASEAFTAISDGMLTPLMLGTLYNVLLEVVALRGSSWMTQTWNTIASKALSSICLPGSHDSGTAVTSRATTFSSPCNTQTQGFDILGQLNAGVRYFDLRPCYSVAQNALFLTHFGKLAGGWWGALGEPLQNALNEVAAFIAQPCGANEIIILKFSHFAQLNAYAPSAMETPQYQQMVAMLNATLGPSLYKRDIPKISLNQQSVYSFKTVAGSYVIALFDVGNNQEAGYFFPTTLIDPAEGIFAFGDTAKPGVTYPISPNFLLYDVYSNSNNFSTMAEDQEAKLKAFQPNKQQSFLLSWTLTCRNLSCSGGQVGPVKNISCIGGMAKYANPLLTSTVLKWANQGIIKKGRMPNILYIDYCGQFGDEAMSVAAELNGRF